MEIFATPLCTPEILFPTLLRYLRGSGSRELESVGERVIFIAAVYYKQMIFPRYASTSYIELVYPCTFLIILDESGCTNYRTWKNFDR